MRMEKSPSGNHSRPTDLLVPTPVGEGLFWQRFGHRIIPLSAEARGHSNLEHRSPIVLKMVRGRFRSL
ncbi:hypothetical protein ACIP29_00515 [Streptomyces coelicoflavus]|uniref:hypothetical protein n=1 Tax=Streptomyces coelicoflavus TaxID=285562 RepID=UPI0038156B39